MQVYNFYLDDVLLPIAPAKLSIEIKNKNKTLDLLDLGEVNMLKDAGLTDIDFDILLPAAQYPFAQYENGFQPPDFYLEKLSELKTAKKPFQLIISRFSPTGDFLFDTNMPVSIESYEIVEGANAGMDITVSIRLKQYKEYQTQTITVQNGNPAANTVQATIQQQRPAREPAKSYTVKPGDTLWAIAKKELGDGSKYAQVASLNGIKNPHTIQSGQVLKLG